MHFTQLKIVKTSILIFLFSLFCILNACSGSKSKPSLSNSKTITAYSINGVNGVIEGSKISVVMPYGTSVTSLAATFTTTGQSVAVGNVTQVSGQTVNNFTNPVICTVTAANGTTVNYTVVVTVASISSKAITYYSLNGVKGVISGFNISVVMPNGTNVSSLVATFNTTGQSVAVNSVTQVSGQTANNFTNPVSYVVTAANGTTATYNVNVTVATNSSKAIIEYSLNGKKGVINGFNISVVMPNGSEVTNLVATFSTTGQSVAVNGVNQVSGQTENNFTNPVSYVVTAANGTTATYTVTVTIASNSSKAITAYSLNGTAGVINGLNISVVMPFGTDITALTATFTTTGQSVTVNNVIQVSGQNENNFTNPVIYTVTAANGTTANYTVTVTVSPNTANAITAYSLNGTPGIISGFNISVVMPYGTSVTNLVATFTTTGQSVTVASVTQISGQTENNFTNPVTYVVTSGNGSSANYTVTVTVAANSSNAITTYSLNGTNGKITGSNISVLMPYGTDVTLLTATFTTTGQSVTVSGVNQVSGQTENNFTNPVIYTVTAASGATATYTVTVTISPNTANAITAYSLNGTNGVINGLNISVVMPNGTNVTSLIATYTTTGQSVAVNSVTQVSGQTANNFTSPVTYVVTAASGATANYVVTVTVAPAPSKTITSFSLSGISSVISGQNIYVSVPSGTNVTNLIATYTTTGQSVAISGVNQVSGQTENNFTNPVTYVVTASDGSTANYIVTVTVGAQTSLGDSPNAIALSPNGNYLYAATSGQYIDWFSVNKITGVLTYLNHLPLGDVPNSVSASANYLFAGTNGAYIDWFSIDQSNGGIIYQGHLLLSVAPVIDLIVSPNGNFLYTSDGSQYINCYSINQSTGALTFQSQLGLQDTPQGLAITPPGTVLYAATTGGYIDWFKVNPNSGAITFAGNYQLQDIPINLALSSTGAVFTLYATTSGGYIDVFAIQGDGSVTFTGNYSYASGATGVAVSASNAYLYTSLSQMISWINVPLF